MARSGLFSSRQVSKKWEDGMTRKLAKALVKVPGVRITSTKGWASEFVRMLTQDGRSKDMVTAAMDWYLQHSQDQYTPKVRSAKTFRQKFDGILAAMERTGGIPLSKQGEAINRELFKRFGKRSWPKSVERALPAVLRRSIHNYTTAWDKMQKFHPDDQPYADIGVKQEWSWPKRLLSHLYDRHVLMPPARFLYWWMECMHDYILRREAYYLEPELEMVWSFDNRHFMRIIDQHLDNWHLDALAHWDQLMGVIK